MLQSPSPEDARQRLMRALGQRSVAGACEFRLAPGARAASAAHVQWAEDFSGELDGLSVTDFFQDGFDRTPAWLLRWILDRPKPFQLRRYSRYIPFSTRLILRASTPPGRRGLEDLLVVPYRQGHQALGALIGLFEPIEESAARELVLLTTAYLARQTPEASAERPSMLTERQLECLQWIVAGKSLEETAEITGMSYSNVRYHLERAKERTGLTSLQQLVAFAAVEYGLSPLGPEYALDRAMTPR